MEASLFSTNRYVRQSSSVRRPSVVRRLSVVSHPVCVVIVVVVVRLSSLTARAYRAHPFEHCPCARRRTRKQFLLGSTCLTLLPKPSSSAPAPLQQQCERHVAVSLLIVFLSIAMWPCTHFDTGIAISFLPFVSDRFFGWRIQIQLNPV